MREETSEEYVILLMLPAQHAQQGLSNGRVSAVVKLLSKRWWIPRGARLEGPKLEPEGSRAEVGFPTTDQGFSSIEGTLFGFCGF